MVQIIVYDLPFRLTNTKAILPTLALCSISLLFCFSCVQQLEQVEGVELEDGQYQNLIIQHMDIEEPLATLRKLLEARLQCSLDDHEFYLQDAIPVSFYALCSES